MASDRQSNNGRPKINVKSQALSCLTLSFIRIGSIQTIKINHKLNYAEATKKLISESKTKPPQPTTVPSAAVGASLQRPAMPHPPPPPSNSTPFTPATTGTSYHFPSTRATNCTTATPIIFEFFNRNSDGYPTYYPNQYSE